MKLVTTLILSAAFALALAACGTSEKKAATEHPASTEHPANTEHPASGDAAATPPASGDAAATPAPATPEAPKAQ